MGNKLTKEAAARNLRTLFGTSTSDTVTINEILNNAGRGNYTDLKNKQWLYNKLSTMNHHNLFTKNYDIDEEAHARVLSSITLTNDGKRHVRDYGISVERPSLFTDTPQRVEQEPSFKSVRADIARLREIYPEFEIIFDAHLKPEEETLLMQ